MWYYVKTCRELDVEVEVAGHYLSLSLKWDVSQEHVVEEDTERPDGGGEGVVLVVQDPLRGSVHLGSCSRHTYSEERSSAI